MHGYTSRFGCRREGGSVEAGPQHGESRRERSTMVRRRKSESQADAREVIARLMDASYREHAELLYAMHELSRAISTRVDKHMARVRVTHIQWWALMHIYEHDGPPTQSQLAEVMQMGRASLGKLLERLETKRWIERRVDKEDSRVRRV